MLEGTTDLVISRKINKLKNFKTLISITNQAESSVINCMRGIRE